MALACAHCRTADLMPLFSTFVCPNCGKHTDGDGRKILPDCLTTLPNHADGLAQFGWPYDDAAPSEERGRQIVLEQWGEPLTRSID